MSWTEVSPGEWSCYLNEACASLKAIHLVGRLPEDVSAEVSIGDGAAGQQQPVIMKHAANGQLDVGLVMLGRGVGFDGTGELFRVSLPGAAAFGPVTIEARDLRNQSVTVKLVERADVDIPQTFEMAQNYPNPFNPSTRISYGLPTAGHVSLKIYGIDGRLVRTLVSEQKAPGRYTVTWTGTDDGDRPVASGTYFYRLNTGSYLSTKKMILMK